MNLQKVEYLEGLRGYASLAVVICHFLCTFALNDPFRYSNDIVQTTDPIILFFYGSPLSFLFDGPLAVNIFFVHSGFVLSWRFFSVDKANTYLSSAAIRRYIRLTGPLAFSVLIGYTLMRLDLMRHGEAQKWIGNTTFLSRSYDFLPHLSDAIYDAFIGSYYSFDIKRNYNPVLWTISAELIGSFILFSFLALFGRARNRWFFYIIAFSLTYTGYYFLFIAGAALCDIVVLRQKSPSSCAHPCVWGWVAIAFLGILLGTANRYDLPQYAWVIPAGSPLALRDFINKLGAILMLVSVLESPLLQRFFQLRISRMFGRLSYSIYLIHLPLICSLTCYLFVTLITTYNFSYEMAGWASAILSIPAILLVSYLYYLMIDKPSIAFAKWVYNKSFDQLHVYPQKNVTSLRINAQDSSFLLKLTWAPLKVYFSRGQDSTHRVKPLHNRQRELEHDEDILH